MKRDNDLTQNKMITFVNEYLKDNLNKCKDKKERENAEKAQKYFREIMNLEQEPLVGLTISEGIELMYRKKFIANRIANDIKAKCHNAIVERTKHFDPNHNTDKDIWFIRLPFALLIEDKNDPDRVPGYDLIEVKKDDIDELYVERWDDNGELQKEFIGWEDRVIVIYQDLKRMGYFDPKYENDFMA